MRFSRGGGDLVLLPPPDLVLLLLLAGYQRELTYKHDDGSYSAFGKSDESGNTWWVEAASRFAWQEVERGSGGGGSGGGGAWLASAVQTLSASISHSV